MTKEEAKEYAKTMTFREAVLNALDGKCVPYRKATKIKLLELLDFIEKYPFIKYENGQMDIDMEMATVFQKEKERTRALVGLKAGIVSVDEFLMPKAETEGK